MAVAPGIERRSDPALGPAPPEAWAMRWWQVVRRDPLLLVFIAGALGARIAFWAISNRMFEDGLTTITHARNVPLGLGLVHHLGEGHVHGFTSAIGVLIPLAGEVVHEGSGMLAMRLASLVAAAVTLVYARLLCRDLGLGVFAAGFVLAYLAFDQNMIFYGMAGMETQVAVLVLLAGIYHVRREDLFASGVWLGLAPLARPEFVLWVAPAVAYVAIRNLRRAAASTGIAGAIVAPWLIFTTAYYGSPIPNTVVAKSTAVPIPPFLAGGSPVPWLQWLGSQLAGHTELLLSHFQPFHEVWSTAAAPLPTPLLFVIAIVVADLVAVGLVASRNTPGWGPVLAFLGLFFAYRVYFIPALNYYDWYLPPFLAVLMIVAAIGLQRLTATRPPITAVAASALGVAFAIHMPFSFVVESRVQDIENQVRVNAGEYLNTHVPAGQSVTSESAGYIGFYGNVKLYDYPGLTSTTSVRAMQSLPPNQRDLPHLVAALRPDWLVLRPWELESLRQEFPDLAAQYQVVQVFQMPGVPDSRLDTDGANLVSFAGLSEVDVDGKFIVLKRTS